MNWYDTFNAVEAALWAVVAVAIPLTIPPEHRRMVASAVLRLLPGGIIL